MKLMTRKFLMALYKRKAIPKGWKMMPPDNFPADISEDIFPCPKNIFRALELISPACVKFIILGQDPYYSCTSGIPDATGVAFAINRNSSTRRHSLTRLMKKIYPKGQENPELTDWVERRGVLLLNAALTVPAGNVRRAAGVHLRAGIWAKFVTSIIAQVRDANPEATLIVWGKGTKRVLADILRNESFVWADHPCASTTGNDSFNEFWNSEPGLSLCMIPRHTPE